MFLEKLLRDQLSGTGFVKRGKAFFRVWGDGVLQVIKFEYQAHMQYRLLEFGLLSMYGNLLKQWFSSWGCITGFSVSLVRSINEGKKERIPPWFQTAEDQLSILKKHALPFLDSIKTQSDMGKALCLLDEVECDEIIWNVSEKVDTFLASGEYHLAERAVNAILHQHLEGSERQRLLGAENWTFPWSESNYSEFEKYCRDDEVDLFQIHHWIASSDHESIKKYLNENYERNCKYAKFCMK